MQIHKVNSPSSRIPCQLSFVFYFVLYRFVNIVPLLILVAQKKKFELIRALILCLRKKVLDGRMLEGNAYIAS